MPVEITVIIPVYNASSTLERCVKSVLSQTLQEYELLLVDDGSENNSMVVMRNFAHKDERIVVLSQM